MSGASYNEEMADQLKHARARNERQDQEIGEMRATIAKEAQHARRADEAERALAEVREMNARQLAVIESHEREIERTKRELGEAQRQSQHVRDEYKRMTQARSENAVKDQAKIARLLRQMRARDKVIGGLIVAIQIAGGIVATEEEDDDFDEVD